MHMCLNPQAGTQDVLLRVENSHADEMRDAFSSLYLHLAPPCHLDLRRSALHHCLLQSLLQHVQQRAALIVALAASIPADLAAAAFAAIAAVFAAVLAAVLAAAVFAGIRNSDSSS